MHFFFFPTKHVQNHEIHFTKKYLEGQKPGKGTLSMKCIRILRFQVYLLSQPPMCWPPMKTFGTVRSPEIFARAAWISEPSPEINHTSISKFQFPSKNDTLSSVDVYILLIINIHFLLQEDTIWLSTNVDSYCSILLESRFNVHGCCVSIISFNPKLRYSSHNRIDLNFESEIYFNPL